jgi:hypothetical protein
MRIRATWSTMCLLAIAELSACGGSDDTKTGSGTQPSKASASAGSKAISTAGASSAAGQGASETRGTCPADYICMAVVFPANEHLCMKPGEVLAPGCQSGDCSALPGATCLDAGFGAGMVCYLSCTP